MTLWRNIFAGYLVILFAVCGYGAARSGDVSLATAYIFQLLLLWIIIRMSDVHVAYRKKMQALMEEQFNNNADFRQSVELTLRNLRKIINDLRERAKTS